MINKQNLWFVTLFSLILILGIYYVSIDDEVASVLEVENDEEKQALMEEYQNVLLDTSSTLEEKNVAYENMQKLNNSKAEENKIKNLLKEKFKYNSFVKIKDEQISIVITEKEHNSEVANNIIRSVQELYDDEKYITVKFNE